MKKIERLLEKTLRKNIKPGKVIGIFGARRTGKTFLMNKIMKSYRKNEVMLLNGEDLDVQEHMSSQRISSLKNFIQDKKYIFIDEAQKIPNIGINLKLIVDTFPDVNILVSGSSSFNLKNQIGEPLTGRSIFYNLFPIAQMEFKEDFITAERNLPLKLIFGTYPQVITSGSNNNKIEILESIKNGYLFKDILESDNLKDSVFILNLLRLIAYQIGNDISYSELATNLKVNSRTVMRYLDLLEKTFVIFRLNGFNRNLRKEIAKSPRYFFWDNGIRNSIINNFNILSGRDDVGKLWENYIISERIKRNSYLRKFSNYYFWRTYDKKEIDLLEESQGKLQAFEIKWKSKKAKTPKEFLDTYKSSKFELINNENYLKFIN